MASTGSSVRNQIVAAVLARIQGIDGTGNYVTSVGTNDARIWRRGQFTFGELPELTINDGPVETMIQERPLGVWTFTLPFEIWMGVGVNLQTASDSTQDCLQYTRDAMADIIFAIGVDRFWTVNGVRLALNTVPGESEIGSVDQSENVICLGLYKFTIQYRTPPFSPNTVATY